MRLPKVFANNNIDLKDNNEKSCISNKGIDKNELRNYFEDGYANKLNVEIRDKNGARDERLILCRDDYVVNINNEKIFFKDIIDFRIKK